MRRAIIAGCTLMVSVIAIVAIFDPLHHLPHGISARDVGVDGTIVTMKSPKISGVRQDGGAYAITAAEGIQDINKPNIMELHGLDVTMAMNDNTTSHISADTGIYDGSADVMNLAGHTRIKNSSGYDLLMQTAIMNFKTGVLSSNERLSVLVSGGTVSADRVEITDGGHTVSFTGHIDSQFTPPDQPDDSSASPAPLAQSDISPVPPWLGGSKPGAEVR
jgi:lipopolysaccharide export system protein LptC